MPATDDPAPASAAPVVRPALPADVRAIRDLVTPLRRAADPHRQGAGRVLRVGLQEFQVAEARLPDGRRQVVGCGALHVMWEDLGEVRTLAVDGDGLGHGVGTALLDPLVERARDLGLSRLFCLTFETGFFPRHGFEVIDGQAVAPEVYSSCCAATTRASPSSSTSSGSSRTPWATPGCSASSDPPAPDLRLHPSAAPSAALPLAHATAQYVL